MDRQRNFHTPNTYRTKKDLLDRLSGCIFMYDGEPFIIQVSTTKTLMLCDTISGQEVKTCRVDDPLLDISSVEMGYFNSVDKVLYAYRGPDRQFHQGICANNTRFFSIDGKPENIMMTENGRRLYVINSDGFRKGLIRSFPSLQEGLTALDSGVNQIALSQEVALQKDEIDIIRVYFRTKLIGELMRDSMSIRLPDRPSSWIADRLLVRLGFNIRSMV